MTKSGRLSVIIPNYNYAAFLPQAIDSALAIDWPDVEVIVVDDGSKDESPAIIASYGDRIIGIVKANAGQGAACSDGFFRSTGEYIWFLDSDDMVDPSVMREAAPLLTPGTSKVQFQMNTINATGESLGNCYPHYKGTPTSDDIARWARFSGAYPTPPASGNVYRRDYLEKIFPIDFSIDPWTDTFCLSAAPYLGEVKVIAKPLVSYRVHGSNDSAMANLKPEHFGTDLKRSINRFGYARGVAARNGITVKPDVYLKSVRNNMLRAASFRLLRENHPIAGDSTLKILADTVRAAFAPQGNSSLSQLVSCAWICGIAVLPLSASKQLTSWRFVPASRPQWLRKFISAA